MKNEINVILSYGYGGAKWSGGLDLLAHRASKLEGVDYVKVYPYTAWRTVERQLRMFKDPTVLIGHSYGATGMLGAARNSGVQVPLIITIDPSQWLGLFVPASWYLVGAGGNVVPGNAFRVHNFYKVGGLIGGLQLAGATNELVENVSHTSIDDYWEVHDKSIALIEQVVRENNE